MGKPKIDINILWDNLTVKTYEWGAIKESIGGINRLSLSHEDKQVRDWFVRECRSLGCEIKIDEVGNIFGIYRDVERPDLNPIGIGSHLDTQPKGGRFDGILGVLSAIEVIRAIKRSNYKPYHPIAAINWTNEEGARFPNMCMGSGVWSGQLKIEDVLKLTDIDGKSVEAELENIGYRGLEKALWKNNRLKAHFEMHIEQALLLEEMTLVNAQSSGIGIVKGIQAMRWYQIIIEGSEGHAGSLLMHKRKDALVAASKLVLILEEAAKTTKSVATVGKLVPKTIAPNTIVGKVEMIFDCRATTDDQLDTIVKIVKEAINQLTKNDQFKITLEMVWGHGAVNFDKECIASVQKALQESPQLPTLQMYSAAGHDSASTASVVPTTMIFVPSVGGLSHNPSEFTPKNQCEDGAQILLDAVLLYDKNQT